MQLTIQKKDLLESIQKVSAAISSRTAIPILTGMKMDVTTNGVVLTGSDSDITIQSHIHVEKNVGTNDEGQVIKETIITDITPGSIVLPVPHFPEIIKKLPEDQVHITVDEQYKTTIKSGKALFTLYGQSTSEYPQVEIHQHDDHINLPVKELKALIRQTVFAVSQMETRPILTGVHVKIDSETITFTATDSHRLALRSIKTNLHDFEETEIVIPGKSLQELNKMMDQNDEFIRIAILKNQVLFYTEDTYFLSRLLSGNYPDTTRLIPSESETNIQIYTKQMIQTIERAALLSNRDQNNVIKLEILDDHVIEITGNSPEVGNVQESFSAIAVEGEPLKISFSSKYLLDTLKTIDSEKVEIAFTGAMRPFIITAPNDEHILQLILPVRTY
ncbi:MAG TPA: DNA polymerase III subunit beta [Pseudogracilibacillus sp.]|nr:DNA polymerase III subunit beta [Pseudogracilibacillus sp.]